MKSLPDRVGAKFICISIFRFFLPLFSWVMCYAFNHFKVGEIKTVLFCFWASIKFHTQKFTLTVISLSLFEILKKWASKVFSRENIGKRVCMKFFENARKASWKKLVHILLYNIFVRYFGMIICWWKLSKQTSYWSRTDFFSQLKTKTIFSSQIIMILSQNNIRKYRTKGHEQVWN